MRGSYVPLYVETEDLDTVVVLPFHCLLPGIEFLPFVDILPTGVTSPRRKSLELEESP